MPLLFIHSRKRDCVDFDCEAILKMATSTEESRQKVERDILACLTYTRAHDRSAAKLGKNQITQPIEQRSRHLIALLAWVPLHANRRAAETETSDRADDE